MERSIMVAFVAKSAITMESMFCHPSLLPLETVTDATFSCVVAETVRYPPSFHPRSHKLRLREVYSPDGRCGPAYGNTICSSDSKVYNGGCCSVCRCIHSKSKIIDAE